MPKYHIVTFGCQMNKSDSERIATVLEESGHHQTDKLKSADLVVVNACSVRQSAVDKTSNKINLVKTLNPEAKIIATGCILKQDKEKLNKIADYILPIKDLSSWPKILRNENLGQSDSSLRYLKTKPKYQTFPAAYVPISFGCNNFCTYCVVPYTRGKEIHRPKNEIVSEIKTLLAKKYNKIILLGENVNNYPDFTALLRSITKLKGDFTVSFLAANPKNFTDGLIDEIAKNQKLEKYIHLPLQSGDNEILKRMNRPYTSQQYLKLVEKIKKKIPDAKIAVDIIVGFPGETKKQFQNTAAVLKKLGKNLYQAYVAKYSPRAGTAAFYMKDNVPAEEKARREQVLRKIPNSPPRFYSRNRPR